MARPIRDPRTPILNGGPIRTLDEMVGHLVSGCTWIFRYTTRFGFAFDRALSLRRQFVSLMRFFRIALPPHLDRDATFASFYPSTPHRNGQAPRALCTQLVWSIFLLLVRCVVVTAAVAARKAHV